MYILYNQSAHFATFLTKKFLFSCAFCITFTKYPYILCMQKIFTNYIDAHFSVIFFFSSEFIYLHCPNAKSLSKMSEPIASRCSSVTVNPCFLNIRLI